MFIYCMSTGSNSAMNPQGIILGIALSVMLNQVFRYSIALRETVGQGAMTGDRALAASTAYVGEVRGISMASPTAVRLRRSITFKAPGTMGQLDLQALIGSAASGVAIQEDTA